MSAGELRVAENARLLQWDLGSKIPPAQGRVHDFLFDKNYVHDPKDEPAIIDWCVGAATESLLCHVITKWRREDLTLRGSEGTFLLETVIPTGLEAGAKTLSLINCIPAANADSDDDCDKLVMVLARATCSCDALALERFFLLSSLELRTFFEYAADRGSLSRLSLCDVSGMDGPALEQLAALLSASRKLEQLRLGGLQSCDARACNTLAQAIGTSAVRTLVLQDCDTRFLLGLLKAMNQLPEGTPISLAQLDISYAIPGDASGQATAGGQTQRDDIDRELSLLRRRFEGVKCDTEVRIANADTQGGAYAMPLDRLSESPLGEQADTIGPDQHPSQGPRSIAEFQNCGEANVLAADITAAVDAGAKHVTLTRCLPGPNPNTSDNAEKLAWGLIWAASRCHSLTLKDFRLLSREEMHLFLNQSYGNCSLTYLSLSGVSGMDMEAMGLLVRLVLRSAILQMHLAEVDSMVLMHFLALLKAHSKGEQLSLKRLDLSYTVAGNTNEHMSADEQVDNINMQVSLLKSCHDDLEINSKRFWVVSEDRPIVNGTDPLPPGHLHGGVSHTIQDDRPGTPPDSMVTFVSVDADKPPEPPSPRTGIAWNPRVVHRPGFLADIVRGLGMRWQAEESSTLQMRSLALEAALTRFAFALTDNEPSKLAWIRKLNRDHRRLWDATYATHLEALTREDMETSNRRARDDTAAIDEMEALLAANEASRLIEYVKQLREKNRLPPTQAIELFLSRHDDDPPRRTLALWALKPMKAMEELARENNEAQLRMWANTLRNVDALPSLKDLQSLIGQYPDGAVAHALYSFLS
jgi:hypothetical protein